MDLDFLDTVTSGAGVGEKMMSQGIFFQILEGKSYC